MKSLSTMLAAFAISLMAGQVLMTSPETSAADKQSALQSTAAFNLNHSDMAPQTRPRHFSPLNRLVQQQCLYPGQQCSPGSGLECCTGLECYQGTCEKERHPSGG